MVEVDVIEKQEVGTGRSGGFLSLNDLALQFD